MCGSRAGSANGDGRSQKCPHTRWTPGGRGHRPQSSSAFRRTAGAPGFLLLIQSAERPER
jgi:hypothetical protein